MYISSIIIEQRNSNKSDNPLTEIKIFDCDKLKEELVELNYRIHLYQDPDKAYEELLKTFDSCSSMKKIKCRKKSKPWFDNHMAFLIKKRDKYFYKKKENPQSEYFLEQYSHFNKLVKKTIREKKYKFYKEQFTDAKSKVIWNGIKSLLHNKTSSDVPTIKAIEIKDTKIENPVEICEIMNNHFVSIGKTLSSVISNISESFEDQSSVLSMFLEPTNLLEIENIIDQLDSKKATGFDGISVKVIKVVKFEISPILLFIISQSFKTGIIPKKMKIAKVSPVYKNGKKTDLNNYRPISILPVISKILEKLINFRLFNFLEKNNLLYNGQYGFRRSKDTEAAVMDVVSNIQIQLDNDQKCTILSLDLCKAFDTVDHDILLKKLYSIGVRGSLHKWFQNYLCDRKQYVYLENNRSSLKDINCGVPQGSILGPVLFLIYINSLSKVTLNGVLSLFADDTTIIYFSSNHNEITNKIKTDVDNIFIWLQQHKLTLNFNKSSFMNISKKTIDIPTLPINFNDKTINYQKTIKFLGLYIDERLSWNAHIDKIRSKLAPLIGILFKIRNYIPLKFLKNIYFSLIYSNLQYLVSIWGTASNCFLNPLKKLQNKTIKCIYKFNYLEPTINLYKPNGLLDLNSLYKLKICCFIHSVRKKVKISNLVFTEVNSIHNHSTRQTKLLVASNFRSNFAKKSIYYNGIVNYNSLSDEIKNNNSMIKFKRKLKEEILK